jgi:adenine-specific DNA-methyltransferase
MPDSSESTPIEKLKMHSPDLTVQNIEKIAALFPGCVTESAGPDGTLRRAIDFDLLRQELSDSIVEGPQERYHLDWPGKRQALITANAPIAKTLRPVRDESVDFDTTRNLFIEGDNLEALKLLQETYLGKVKMIYIDPPYNTGNDLVYDDDFVESTAEFLAKSLQVDDDGNRLVANTQANGRFHSDWLSMLSARLRLAKNLLSDDGILFASIDDNEVENFLLLGNEVFGRENKIGVFVWRRRQTSDNRNFSRFSNDHEYVVAYRKTPKARLLGRGIDKTKYSNPDSDPRGPWTSENLSGLATASQRPNLHFDIVNPETGISYPPNPARGWSKSKDNIEKMISERRILWPKSDQGRPREKKFLENLLSNVTGFSSWLDSSIVGFNSNGTREVAGLMGGKVFDFPKPIDFLKTFVSQATVSDDLVLDFFAGSASTAHAVLEQSRSDGMNRRYVMVQVAEQTEKGSEAAEAGFATIADLSKERIRRAGREILKGECHHNWNRDVGFRMLKVDSSNMAEVYYTPDATAQADLLTRVSNIKAGRSPEDLLFQVLLDWGVDLTLPISRETVAGKTVFTVAGTALIACFDNGVDEALVKELAARKPLRVVFKDTGFKDDSTKINVKQIFKSLSPDTEVKAI